MPQDVAKDEFATALARLFDDGPSRVKASASANSEEIELRLTVPKSTLDSEGAANIKNLLALLVERDV
ncbi:MAG: hypothetical protein RIC85_00515 [Gammaproteobacteria bacterium]